MEEQLQKPYLGCKHRPEAASVGRTVERNGNAGGRTVVFDR
ncbi:hypothetical protein SOVF_184180 isoform A [Spinacia oleracea]|nr:hypothetical protein SOVF_184180 isoform A [Spinacia oleracea]